MTYYVYLKQKAQGCDYNIGCGEKLITIDASNDEDLKEKLSEIILSEYTGEMSLSKVLIFRDPINFDLKSVQNKSIESAKKLQHLADMEEFERLKRKLGFTGPVGSN